MAASPSSVLTRGLGSWGSSSLLLTRGLGISTAVIVTGPFRSVAGQAWTAGSDKGQTWLAGSIAAQQHTAGSDKGQFV